MHNFIIGRYLFYKQLWVRAVGRNLGKIEYKAARKNIVDLDRNLNIFIQVCDKTLLLSSET